MSQCSRWTALGRTYALDIKLWGGSCGGRPELGVPRHGVYTSEVVGGMGGLGPGRSGGPMPGRPIGRPNRLLQRLLGGCAAWTEHASTGETDGLLTQWVSARTFPAPACDARNPCHCAAIHTHVRPARPPISEHPITARNMASTCTLHMFTYALAGRPRSNAIDCELCEKMANKLAGRAEGG